MTMEWQVREVNLPVRFGVYSLEWVMSEKRDFDYIAGIDRVQKLLESTKEIDNIETLKEKLDDVKEKVDDLKDGLSDESPLESYLTSLSPVKKGILVSMSAILKRGGKRNVIDNRSLGKSPYFVQVLRANNRRQIFGKDISNYSYIAKPFNDKDQLIQLINSVQIPEEYQDNVLGAFDSVLTGEPEKMGGFSIPIQERYHPTISKLVTPVRYATASGGVVLGAGAGAGVGAAIGGMVSIVGGMVGVVGLMVGAVGLMAGSACLIAGGAYGLSKGAELGYKLQDRLTGNHQQITS